MSEMSGQSAGGYRPAGWYHAQGDPPGTRRYWDGAAWQGEPQAVEPAVGHEPMDSPADTSTVVGGAAGYTDHGTGGQAFAGSNASATSPPGSSAPPVTAAPSTSSGSPDVGGFLSTLFDTKFTQFITGRAISVVYILVMIAVALMTLGIVISGASGGGLGALIALIVGPLLGLFYLVMIRMTLEFFVNQFRQTELLEEIADRLERDRS